MSTIFKCMYCNKPLKGLDEVYSFEYDGLYHFACAMLETNSGVETLKRNLNAELEITIAEFLQLKAQHEDMEDKLERLKQENTVLTVQNDGRQKKLQSKNVIINDLHERLRDAILETNMLHQSLKTVEEENQVLSANNEEQKTAGQNSTETMATAQDKPSYVPIQATINGKLLPVMVPKDIVAPVSSTNSSAIVLATNDQNQCGVIKSPLSVNVLNQTVNMAIGVNHFVDNVLASNNSKKSLFLKAKELRRYGYKFVYASNGLVFARLNKKTKPLLITSHEQVDEMIAEHVKANFVFL